MRELTFFTSSQTKLAHARYLAEGHRIKIKSFRQRTYHAGYVEPRLTSRDEILLASYASAKAQLAKAGISETIHPFILEDTSVRIEALSTTGVEVPGVDIKYWMEEQTFARLDRMLRQSGNDRRAVVRSDILLHVPTSLRRAWRVDAPFLVFTGEQEGSIIDAEYIFESNAVYPWLDNRSFNKWFSPNGYSIPLGALPIGVADGFDFRRRSFERLFEFLENREYLVTPMVQLVLQLDSRPNIIISGYTCSGKTTASQSLAKRFGYLHIEASDFMYLSFYYRHGYRDLKGIGDFAEDALSQSPTTAAERVVDYMLEHPSDPVVISGFRAPEEISFIEDAMKANGRTFTKRFIDASEAIRYARLRARARPGDNLNLQQFRHRDSQQLRMGLDKVASSQSMSLLANEGELEDYLIRVDRLVEGACVCDLDVSAAITAIKASTDAPLQEAILIALLGVWEGGETRDFYSTTQIAALIAVALPNIRPKHKDNVSRYFNQDYYAYYEISHAPGRGTRKFRLSNTGYGMAMKTLRDLIRSLVHTQNRSLPDENNS